MRSIASLSLAALLILSTLGAQAAPKTDAAPEEKEQTQFDLSWTAPKEYTGKSADVMRGLLGFRKQDMKPKPPRPWLGVQIGNVKGEIEALGGAKGEVGAVFDLIVADSPAAKAGLKKGDVVVAWNDKKLNPKTGAVQSLIALIRKHKPDGKVSLTVLRDKKRVPINLVLGTFQKAVMPEHPYPGLDLKAADKLTLLEAGLKAAGMTKHYADVEQMLKNDADTVWSPGKIADGVLNPFRLSKFTTAFRRPALAAEVADRIVKEKQEAFNEKTVDPAGLIVRAAADLDVTLDPKAFPVQGSNPKERLLDAFKQAHALRKKAFAKLTADEIKLLETNGRYIYLASPEGVEHSDLAIFKIGYKVDYKALFSAAHVIARELAPDRVKALVQYASKLDAQKIKQRDARLFQGDLILVENTPFGKLVIGGQKDNTYGGDAAIIIDLGGNDIYKNNAGASTSASRFAVVIDAKGNDIYAGGDESQGFGYTGAGFLVDLAGNDSYRAGDIAQAIGIFGVGMILDMAGDDSYRAKKLCQGAGLFGIGILADHSGNDSYYAEEYAQGFGGVKGFGAILEVAGQDSYWAGGKNADGRDMARSFVSFAQGVGLGYRNDAAGLHVSGGIGMIADAAGHDHYAADYFSQGSGYWFSFGILADDAGGDNYFCGRYSQGAGIHYAIGVILDHGGNDHYTAYFGVSQGCGHDISIGIIQDDAGNDKYTGGVITLGAGNDTAIGMIIDLGGSDEYSSAAFNYSLARGNLNAGRKLGAIGIVIDLGGDEDRYADPALVNNAVSTKTHWGLLIDMPKPKPKEAPKVETRIESKPK